MSSPPVYDLSRMFTQRKKPVVCKGRQNKACKSSAKTCLWAHGSKRSFCRKRAKTRRKKSSSSSKRRSH